MLIILATWEAEIGRIAVQGQPRQIVPETPVSKINRAKCTCKCLSTRFSAEKKKPSKYELGYDFYKHRSTWNTRTEKRKKK
jgi:hypothetical protein